MRRPFALPINWALTLRAGFYLSLAVWAMTLLVNPALAQGLKLKLWSDPQFEIPVPADWYPSEATWVAERLFFATPEPTSPDELLASSGVDADALIQVKVDALDTELRRMPLQQIAQTLRDRYRSTLQQANVRFEILAEKTATLDGREAVILSTIQDNMRDHTVLARTEQYLYEIRLAYKEAFSDQYKGLFDAVSRGVTFKRPSAEVDYEPITTLIGQVALPASWHITTLEGKTPRVFVTRTEIRGKQERIWVGATLLKIHNYHETFGLSQDNITGAYQAWLKSYVEGMQKSAYRLLTVERIALQGRPSLLIEASFIDETSGRAVQLFNVSTVMGANFYNATLEAPVEEFYALRPMYLKAIQSLSWR